MDDDLQQAVTAALAAAREAIDQFDVERGARIEAWRRRCRLHRRWRRIFIALLSAIAVEIIWLVIDGPRFGPLVLASVGLILSVGAIETNRRALRLVRRTLAKLEGDGWL